ncbi:MAG: (2Fe-2S)-binding protein [Alphaproteobacteria bacterium]
MPNPPNLPKARPREGQFVRLAGTDRPALEIVVDGAPVSALAGDTLLTALLIAGHRLRESEFGDGPRAGFCLMGACQDCWVSLADGRRVRACTTPVAPGMRVETRSPGAT